MQGEAIGCSRVGRLRLTSREGLEGLLDWDADDSEVGRALCGHAAHLVAATKIEHGDRGDLLAQVEG